MIFVTINFHYPKIKNLIHFQSSMAKRVYVTERGLKKTIHQYILLTFWFIKAIMLYKVIFVSAKNAKSQFTCILFFLNFGLSFWWAPTMWFQKLHFLQKIESFKAFFEYSTEYSTGCTSEEYALEFFNSWPLLSLQNCVIRQWNGNFVSFYTLTK